MADEVVVTELTIDARGAEAGSATYVKAMKSAQAAYDKAMDSANAATEAVAKQTTVMTGAAGGVSSTAKAWERFKASVDPAFAATQQMEKALLTADAAAKKLGVDQAEINRVMDLARVKHLGAAASLGTVGNAARLTSNQMLNLSRQGNDVITMFALGAPPMQIFASQAGQVFDALESGPMGAIGSLKVVGTAILNFVTEPLGGVITAATLAGGAMAAYALATRNDIKSADEVLKGHKALIDEIAKAYPAAAAAAKKYEDQASQMPKSVIAADTADNVADARKTLAKDMNDIRRQMDLLNTGDGDFARIGKAGIERFTELSKEIKSGTLDAVGLQNELGRIRLDPTLSKNAHEFAKGLQDTADKAALVAATIPADLEAKGIAVDNQKATKSLAEVAAGLKDVSSNAGTADTTIAKLFGTVNSGGSDGFGVTRSLGGSVQGIVGQFEQAGQAIQDMRREQVQSQLDLTKQFRDTTTQVAELKDAIASAAKDSVKDFFGGDVSNIKNANSELQTSVDRVNSLFDALNTGSKSANAVASGLDLIRKTLVNDGFGVDQVNKFMDSLISAREQMDADIGKAKQLNAAIQGIKNRTVTITVVTQQVGTGTKSTYDVGTTGGIGVTRYGSGSAPSMSAYSVPSTGYGSQGGSGDSGTGTVGVTRFSSEGPWQNPTGATAAEWSQLSAQNKQDIYNGKTDYAHILYPQYYAGRASGGPVSAHTPYWVGEKGPELVVPSSSATVIPHDQSMALANPQSAFTGRDPTTDSTRYYTVFMNIEANTRKTFNALDDMKTSGAFSGGGSSSGSTGTMTKVGSDLYDSNGLNAGGHTDAQVDAFNSVLASARSNYSAMGGMGLVGYGANALAATPQQIAANIAYNGGGGVGVPGANSYEKTLTQTAISMYQQEVRRHKAVYGFATGGMIGGDSSDTQKVEFFKRPSERVIIADNDQLDDQRSGSSRSSGAESRPIVINQVHNWNGNTPPTKESMAETRRQTALGLRDALRSVNGR